jgi:hypothetical protein
MSTVRTVGLSAGGHRPFPLRLTAPDLKGAIVEADFSQIIRKPEGRLGGQKLLRWLLDTFSVL